MGVKSCIPHILIALIIINITYGLITPPQILLPYISDESGIVIRAQIRATPTRCVFWSTPTPDTICLTSPACLSDTSTSIIKSSSYCDCQVSSKCLESVWVGAKKSLTLPYRTWVSISDKDTDERTDDNSFSEVIVKALESIDFQTRNRKIAVGQLATLRLVGFDEDKNTFTSLQGIPFKLTNSDESVMKITELTNDPDEATPTRMNLIKRGLHSDVIIVQGLKVGESVISVQVDLPEYSHIGLNVKFMVSEPFILEPSLLNIPFGSKANFCLRRINQESSTKEADMISLPQSHYKWIYDSPLIERLTDRGQLSLHFSKELTENDQQFTISVQDVRSVETSLGTINASKPVALAHSIQSLSCAIKDYPDIQYIKRLIQQKDLEELQISTDAFFWHQEGDKYSTTFNKLYRTSLAQCQPFPPLNSSKDQNSLYTNNDFIHLSRGRTYLFKLSILDSKGRELSIPENAKLTAIYNMEKNMKILWKSPTNHLMVLYTNDFGEGSLRFVLTSIGNYTLDTPIEYNVKYQINKRIHVERRTPTQPLLPPHPNSDMRLNILRHYTSIPINPIYLEPPLPNKGSGECFSLAPLGGSGIFYAYSEGDSFVVTSDNNRVKICPRSYGFDVITIEDSLDPANMYLLPVHSVHVEFIIPYPRELHIGQDDESFIYLLPISVDKGPSVSNMPLSDIEAQFSPTDTLEDFELKLSKYGYHIVRNFNDSLIKFRHSNTLSLEPHFEEYSYKYMIKCNNVGVFDVEIDFQDTQRIRINVYESIKLSIAPPPFHPLTKPPSSSAVADDPNSGGLFSFLYSKDDSTDPIPMASDTLDEYVFMVGSRIKILVSTSVQVNADPSIFKVEVTDSTFYLTCMKESYRNTVIVTSTGPQRVLPISCTYPSYSKLIPYDMGSTPILIEDEVDPEIITAKERPLTLAHVLYDRRGHPIIPSSDVVTHWYQISDEVKLLTNDESFYITLNPSLPFHVMAISGVKIGDRDSKVPKSFSKTLTKFGNSPVYVAKFDRKWMGSMDAIFDSQMQVNLVSLPSLIPADNLSLPIRDLYYMMALDIPLRDDVSDEVGHIISSFSQGLVTRNVFMGRDLLDDANTDETQSFMGRQYRGKEVLTLLPVLSTSPSRERHLFLIDASTGGDATASFTVKDVLNSRGGELRINFVKPYKMGISVWLCKNSDCIKQIGPEESLVHLQAGVTYTFILTVYDDNGREIYPPSLKGLRAELTHIGNEQLHFNPHVSMESEPFFGDLAFTLSPPAGEFVIRANLYSDPPIRSNYLTLKSYRPLRVASNELVLLPKTFGFEFDLVDGPSIGVGRALGFKYKTSNEKVVSIGPDNLLKANVVGDATVTLDGDSGIGIFSLSVKIHVRTPRGIKITPPSNLFPTMPHLVRIGRWIPLTVQLYSDDGLTFTPHYLGHGNSNGKSQSNSPQCVFNWNVDNPLIAMINVTNSGGLTILFHALALGNVNVHVTANCPNGIFKSSYPLQVIEDVVTTSQVFAKGLQYNFEEGSIVGTSLISYSSKPANSVVTDRVGHLVLTEGERLVSVAGIEAVDSFYLHAFLRAGIIRVELVASDGRPVQIPRNLPLLAAPSRQGIVSGLVLSSSNLCSSVLISLDSDDSPYSSIYVCGHSGSANAPSRIRVLPGASVRFAIDQTRCTVHFMNTAAVSVTSELVSSELGAVYRPVVVERSEDNSGKRDSSFKGSTVTFSFASPDDNLFGLQERIANLSLTDNSGVDIARSRLEAMLRTETLPVVTKSLNMALSFLPRVSRYSLIPHIDWYYGIRYAPAQTGGYMTFNNIGVNEISHSGTDYYVEVIDNLEVTTAYHNGSDYYALSDEPIGSFILVFKTFINGELYHPTEFILPGLFPQCNVEDGRAKSVFKFTPQYLPFVKDGAVISLAACKCELASLDEFASVNKFDPKEVKLTVSLGSHKRRYFEKEFDLWGAVKATSAFYNSKGELITRVAVAQSQNVIVYPASPQIKPRLIHVNNNKTCAALREERRGLVIYLTIVRVGDSKCVGHVADLDLGSTGGILSFGSTPLIPGRTVEVHLTSSSIASVYATQTHALTSVLTIMLVLFASYYISRRIQSQSTGRTWGPQNSWSQTWHMATSPWVSHQHSSRIGGINIQRDQMPKVVQDLYSPPQ